jgi:hypothetical protein
MGDVETVIDLLGEVLQPIAEDQGLATWNDVCAFTKEDWFPSRIAFGKFKGRDFRDATDDEQLRRWLVWLSESSNERSARMGKWYFSQLDAQTTGNKDRLTEHVFDRANVQTEKEAFRPSRGSDVTLSKSSAYRHSSLLHGLDLPNSNPPIPKTKAPLTTYRLRFSNLSASNIKQETESGLS